LNFHDLWPEGTSARAPTAAVDALLTSLLGDIDALVGVDAQLLTALSDAHVDFEMAAPVDAKQLGDATLHVTERFLQFALKTSELQRIK
jgi:hypothetical protein